MNNPPNKIPQEEYDNRVRTLIKDLLPKGQANPQETKELFELHNDRYLPRETNTGCSACRSRVFNRMKTYYEGIKNV